MKQDTVWERKDVLVGWTAEGWRVYVDGRIEHVDASDEGGRNTVEHSTIKTWEVISISGSVFSGRKNTDGNCESGGQCSTYLSQVTKFAPGWSAESVNRLHEIWQNWHLNSMNGGCSHMDLPEDTSYDVRKDIRCPHTGYKYGSEWLVKPLPDGLVEEFKALFDK